MQGGVDHAGVGWVMQGWGGSYRGRVGHAGGGLGHARVGWCGSCWGGSCMVGWGESRHATGYHLTEQK